MKPAVLALSTFIALTVASAVAAGNDDWRFGWDGTLYGYANTKRVREDSVLNPDNQLAQIPNRNEVAELRLNFKAENERFRLTARPILLTRATHGDFGNEQRGETYFSQWQARVRVAEGWNASVGREVLNWGPAQFRSPSSPFYFNSGRNDPMRELVGMDSVKLSWTPNMQSSAMLVHIVDEGNDVPPLAELRNIWRDSWLAKYDQRGDGWAYAVIAAKTPDQTPFYGAYGQFTVSDSLLVYGEIGSSSLMRTLQSPADLMQPFEVLDHGSRRTTTLVGTTYTFEEGHSLAAEYLHTDHGYTSAQDDAYFQRAVSAPGLALGMAPRLLGRDYLHLVLQSNMMDEHGYWRLMYTHNFTDNGGEISAYGERVLSSKVTAFMLGALPQRGAEQEFSALIKGSLTVGLKFALP